MGLPPDPLDMLSRIEELERRATFGEMPKVDERSVVAQSLDRLNVVLRDMNLAFKYEETESPRGGIGYVWGHLATLHAENYAVPLRITMANVPDLRVNAVRSNVATIVYVPPYDDGHAGDVYTVGVPEGDFKYQFRSIDELFNPASPGAPKAREYICLLAATLRVAFDGN
jgi:hypothetical protein